MSNDLVRFPVDSVPSSEPVDPYGKKSGYQSWQQTIRRIGNTKTSELRRIYGEAIENLEKYGNITLRELAVLKAYETLISDPNPAMLGLIMERDEGRVPQTVVSASGNVQDWMAFAKENDISLDEVMAEARKMIDTYEQPPDILDGEIVD